MNSPGLRWSVNALLLGFLWWVISEGYSYQPWFGPSLVVAALVFRILLSRDSGPAICWPALVGLLPFFLYHSIRGGLQVAASALNPGTRVSPRFVTIPLRIPETYIVPRLVFATVLGLFPGTLSCGLRGNELTIHVLDDRLVDLGAVHALERRIIALFHIN
ncbi:MAG: hypothetical protein A2428_01935 [Bdellovibrionales bacterium RIFOXYC1_FULL_54_43]|nr:MAG: hypothetical protein A2428_01935 [Bdellovibrionales bacterium RIFOXYC1_FULL_54_43]OFZ81699.1 MAG: hypothetical protein A2603_12145 [Bdellovibrionales bacterium RIFOXYD1_FULL_55_31]